jgi:uncharacterized protein YjbJ (UPF0337 family)
MDTVNTSQAAAADDRPGEASGSWTSSMLESAQDTAGRATDGLKDRARGVAEQQKSAGAEQIEGVADAMKAAAGDLRDKIPLASAYIDDAAGRLGQIASTLRERSVDDVLGNVAEFARKQPAMFFAGAVAAGFALSRFAKSSAKREGSDV